MRMWSMVVMAAVVAAGQNTLRAEPANEQVAGTPSVVNGAAGSDAPAAGSSSAAEIPTSQPAVLQIAEANHHFGQVWAGAELSHTFRFVNTGPRDVHIQRVTTSCGCTTTQRGPARELTQAGSFAGPRSEM